MTGCVTKLAPKSLHAVVGELVGELRFELSFFKSNDHGSSKEPKDPLQAWHAPFA